MTRRPLVEPTGPHPVGRTTHDWTDPGRVDPYGRGGGSRRLNVWLWYPAERAGTGPYLTGWARAGASIWGLRPGRVTVPARTGAKPAAAPGAWPVVVFSPSANPAQVYSALCAELASHGYVVCAVTHTYEPIPFTAFADGTFRLVNPASLGGALRAPGSRPFEEDLREREAVLRVKADDLRFVVDRLERLGERGGHPLAGRLDLSRVALAGHSFGGGAAFEACRVDPRCRAGISLDGALWRAPAEAVLAKPFLQLFAEHPEYTQPVEVAVASRVYRSVEYAQADRTTTIGAWQALHDSATPGVSALIRGAVHTSFSDWPLLPAWGWSPIRRALGPALGRHAWRVTSDWLLWFLGRHLGAGAGPPGATAAPPADDRVVVGPPADLFRETS